MMSSAAFSTETEVTGLCCTDRPQAGKQLIYLFISSLSQIDFLILSLPPDPRLHSANDLQNS